MIKLVKSTFYKEKETKKRLNKFISSATQLSFGSECEKFEKNFAKYQGRKYSVFFNSGSSANLALIQALLNKGDLKKKDKVAFSALTWSTNVMPIIQLGLTPIPVDVEMDTLNVSSKQLKKVMNKHKIKAFLATNILGFCDDIDTIRKTCRSKNLVFLEDNCESLGTIYKGKKLGNFGLASTFSFYVGHHMSTIEGGSVCTDDKDLAYMLKLVRAHGWDRNVPSSHRNRLHKKHGVKDIYANFTFYDLGYNIRPTEIHGFLGNNQLMHIDTITKKRNKNFHRLASVIYTKNNKYSPIRHEHIDFVSNFAFPLVCRNTDIRDSLIKSCRNKIEIRPIVGGDMTQQPFFRKYVKLRTVGTVTNVERIQRLGLYIGNNPELTNKELKTIESIL